MKQVLTTNESLLFKSSPNHPGNHWKLFSKYRLIILFTCISMIVSSCQKEDLFNLFHEHHKETVPLIAVFHVTLKTIQASDFVSITELDSVYGTGKGMPIGISTFRSIAIYAPPDYNLTGSATITSENGDRIFFTSQGPGPAVDTITGNIVLNYHATITGGTGRFEDATGGWNTIAHASTHTTTGVDSLQGTITY